jgi:hypothetical protein
MGREKRGERLSAELPAIAVINSTPDAVELLRNAFTAAGFVVVTCYTHDIRDGKVDFEAFMRQHQPRVIVYDIAPPYGQNFRLYEHIRSMPAARGCQFVITSMNPARLEGLVGRDEQVYEVVDRAEDIERIVWAAKEASRARPTR